jgi:uroporphyrinogen decarboxylase
MTGKERTEKALRFEEPDRVPRYWQGFWPEFEAKWTERRGETDLNEYFGDDMKLVAANETAWPTRAGVLERSGETVIVRSGWGETKRTRAELLTSFEVIGELVEPAVPDRIDPDKIEFEDPLMDIRFEKAAKQAEEWKDEYFVWCKSGGPYLRAAFMRGDENFWIDTAEDPQWARAFVDRVVEHIMAVALEAMKRFGLQETGIAIYDDVAANWGPFVGAKRYEEIFLPALRRMITTYKEAGATRIMHHSDGNPLPLLDMWIDAGVDAINPVEYHSGLDPVKLREQYGNKLVCTGGLDNIDILVRGDKAEIKDHIQHILNAGRGGGYVIGPHSIGPDIEVETMEYVLELLEVYGNYPLS